MKKISLLKKLVLVLSMCLPLALKAQDAAGPKFNWQNLDLKTDSVFGISTEKTYTELLKGKPHVTVLVAVIDGGVDVNHEDLKPIIWNNPGETAGNNIDDDKNGYVDDIHGWDFIGSAKGDVEFDNLEITRLVRLYNTRFTNTDTTKLKGKNLDAFNKYRKMRADLAKRRIKGQATYDRIAKYNDLLDLMITRMHVADPVLSDFQNYTPQDEDEEHIKQIVIASLPNFKDFADMRAQLILAGLKYYKEQLDYHLNVAYDPRSIVGDNYTNVNEHFYGNNDVTGPDADHGTHVSGIIGAVRDNNLGVMGVANDVRIMSVRTVPNGDERDKDVANAIRYAAANGAKVINMSFGKDYSYNKKAVDKAVKFAMKKDVLLVHAAGNDNDDNDTAFNVPNPVYQGKNKKHVAKAWIEVGASGPKDDETLKASFSNYGKTSVDVFAPGVNIKSTTPKSTYSVFSGTSMASPVVAGLAALIRSYYPKLSALQVKDIIMKSVVKVTHTVAVAGQKTPVPFTDLCVSGGIVNTYNALKLAATY